MNIIPSIGNKEIDFFLYIFSDAEMQARQTEFFAYLREIPKEQVNKNIYAYNRLCLSQMEQGIQKLIINGDENTIKQLFQVSQTVNQAQRGNNAYPKYNQTSFNLEQQRAKLLKYYNKKYNAYLGKLIKILGFFLR